MARIVVNMANLDPARAKAIVEICPFGAMEYVDGKIIINGSCRMCRLCLKRDTGGAIRFEDTPRPVIDKSKWKGIAVYAELSGGALHPVSLELLGKARELAAKVGQEVYAVLPGASCEAAAKQLVAYGADRVYVYEHPELENFRIEPYSAVIEDFIVKVHPAVLLAGGTPIGRTLAPRLAARFRTGLTADCTVLDIKENTDLEQIRPAFGGNIMAHINTPNHRPQFATVRYKIFALPEPVEKPSGVIEHCSIDPAKLTSDIRVVAVEPKSPEVGIEEAEVIVAVGRGVKKQEDLELFRRLAAKLNGQLAGTRCLVENGWLDHRCQIGLSGRTVSPKLILCCGISGSVQFVAGMKGAEKIIAVNTDPAAPIFNVAHIGIVGDLYEVLPRLETLIAEGGAR